MFNIKYKFKWLDIVFFIFCVLFFLLTVGSPKYFMPSVSSEERITRCKLRSIVYLKWKTDAHIWKPGVRAPSPLLKLMKEENISMGDALFYIISNPDYADLFGFNSKQIEALKFDGWGEPFHSDYATNITEGSQELLDYLSSCDIVVWSGGKNRKDDRCCEDDIVKGNFGSSVEDNWGSRRSRDKMSD